MNMQLPLIANVRQRFATRGNERLGWQTAGSDWKGVATPGNITQIMTTSGCGWLGMLLIQDSGTRPPLGFCPLLVAPLFLRLAVPLFHIAHVHDHDEMDQVRHDE